MSDDTGPLFDNARSRRGPRKRGAERQAASAETSDPKVAEPPQVILLSDGSSVDKTANTSVVEPAQVIVLGEENSRDKAGTASSPWPGDRNPLTAAFLLTFVFGVFVEAFGGFIFIDHPNVSSLLAATGMLLYFAYGFLRPKSVRNTEQFADSLYFLGFILTLWALLLAMTNLVGGGAEITSRNIIEKFGIAITTTFVGMTLRILLIQMRSTASDQEEEARDSIAQYVIALNSEIAHALTEIKSFRVKAIEEAADAAHGFSVQMERIGASSGQAVTDSNAAILKSVQQVTARIAESMADIVRRLAALEVPTDIFAARFNTSADALSADIDQLRKSVSDNTGSFARSLSESVSSMGRVSGDIDALRKVISTAQQQLATAASISNESAGETQRFAHSATAAIDAMVRFQDVARQLATALLELNQRLQAQGNSHTQEISRLASDLKGAIAEARDGASQFSSTMASSARQLRDAIEDASDAK
jgi:ABC-type transporter Mla subunit MlaD